MVRRIRTIPEGRYKLRTVRWWWWRVRRIIWWVVGIAVRRHVGLIVRCASRSIVHSWVGR